MERRGFFRRLRMRVCDLPLLQEYNSTARLFGLPKLMALVVALYALDYERNRIAFAMCVRGCTVRKTVRAGLSRLGARDRGDAVRILQELNTDRS